MSLREIILILLAAGGLGYTVQDLVRGPQACLPVLPSAEVRAYIDSKIKASDSSNSCADLPTLVGRVVRLENLNASIETLKKEHDLLEERLERYRKSKQEAVAGNSKLLDSVRKAEIDRLRLEVNTMCVGVSAAPGARGANKKAGGAAGAGR